MVNSRARAVPKSTNNAPKDDQNISGLIDVAIQSFIIGVITFLPKNGGLSLVSIGGPTNWVMMLSVLVISLCFLLIIRKYVMYQ